VAVPADADDEVLAEVVSRAVRRTADVVPHPGRDEWPACASRLSRRSRGRLTCAA